MPEPTEFGRRLKRLRDAREWTQEDLATRSTIPAAMISHFERGQRQKPSADTLVKLANALDVSIDYLLGRSDEPDVASPRIAALLRGLATASSETVDAALTVVESLLRRERAQEQSEADGLERESGSEDRQRRS